MRPLLLHLRAAPLRWAVLALTGLDLAMLFLHNTYRIGNWPQSGRSR